MIAVEIAAPIINHRVDFSSDKLPSNVARARIIVMYEEDSSAPETVDIVALARAARASFPQSDPQHLQEEFSSMRAEWSGRGYGK